MLLAMVITIMGGVWVFLNPYLSDFEDNTNWNSATGLADRIEDRIEVAGNAPEGTGFRNTLAIQSTAIRSVQNVEHWTIGADSPVAESIDLRQVNETVVGVLAANETARSIRIESPGVVVETSVPVSHSEVFITHNASASHWMIVTVYDADDEPLHRYVTWTLSGLQITTSLGQGEHQIVLMNNARAERFPNGAWDVSAMPLVEFDRMANDELRLSMLLTDSVANGSIGSGSNVGMQFVSQGPMTLFSDERTTLISTYKTPFTTSSHRNTTTTGSPTTPYSAQQARWTPTLALHRTSERAVQTGSAYRPRGCHSTLKSTSSGWRWVDEGFTSSR